jgi:protein subunit release factor A
MAEVDEVEITLDENDLDITSTFSAGPGGQHMQKNATAARIVHKPTGIAVKIQSERSLTQNKRLGMAIIQGDGSSYWLFKLQFNGRYGWRPRSIY